jgi:hypothetical protein
MSQLLITLMTKKELFKATKSMATRKAPCLNGIVVEFLWNYGRLWGRTTFKWFWKQLIKAYFCQKLLRVSYLVIFKGEKRRVWTIGTQSICSMLCTRCDLWKPCDFGSNPFWWKSSTMTILPSNIFGTY